MAATSEIKQRIVIEGEAQYKRAMAEINRALTEQKSAVRAAQAEYDAADSAMRSSSTVAQALADQYDKQGDALELMQRQLKEYEDALGKNSREATTLRTRINNMRTEMAKTTSQIKRLETGTDDLGEELEDASAGAAKAGEGITGLGTQAEGASGQLQGMLDQLTQITGFDLSGLAGKLTIAGVGAGAAKAAKEIIELGTGTVQAWRQLAAYTGATGENLEILKDSAVDVYIGAYADTLNEAASAVATVHTYTGLMGEDLTTATENAMLLDEVFGMDLQESSRAASVLMNQFGIDGEKAYGLIATAAQQGADKNGNLLDTINEYSPYFARAGMSADGFFAALVAGAQSGVYDVDKIGDAFKEFTLRMTDGSDTTREALTALGLEASDIPAKFAQGGEAARAATQLVIDRLAEVEDPLERQRLGVAIFGSQWEDTGGQVLGAFQHMDDGIGNTQEALDGMNQTRMSDLDIALQGLSNRITTMLLPAAQSVSQAIAGWVQGINTLLDGGSLSEAVDTAAEVGGRSQREQMQAIMDQYGVDQGEAVYMVTHGIDPSQAGNNAYSKTSSVIDTIKGWFSGGGQGDVDATIAASADGIAAKSQAETIRSMGEAMPAAGEETIALLAGGMDESAPEMERAGQDAATTAIDAVDAETGEMEATGQTFGEAGVLGTEVGLGDMAQTGEEGARQAIDAMQGQTGAMSGSGAALGGAGVSGARSGLSGMSGAGADGAAGLVAGLASGVDVAYSAGYRAGQAYERGYRAASKTHSPSRVMEAAGEDTIAGLMQALDTGESEAAARGAALADALAGGYRGAQEPLGGAVGAFGGGMEDLPTAVAQAVREALSDLGLYADGALLGRVGARGASREIARQSRATLAGSLASVKGW